jgi:hypothetical protein
MRGEHVTKNARARLGFSPCWNSTVHKCSMYSLSSAGGRWTVYFIVIRPRFLVEMDHAKPTTTVNADEGCICRAGYLPDHRTSEQLGAGRKIRSVVQSPDATSIRQRFRLREPDSPQHCPPLFAVTNADNQERRSRSRRCSEDPAARRESQAPRSSLGS